MAIFPFNRESVLAGSERAPGLYVIGNLKRGLLVPLYVGRSDSDGSGRGGRNGVRGRLLEHLGRDDWLPFLNHRTHFAVSQIDDPESNFEAEAWHYHHYRLPLNGGWERGSRSGHPDRPRHSPFVCPEPGCHHHHARTAAIAAAMSMHARGQKGFRFDWASWRRRMAVAQWGYGSDPQGEFKGILVSPLTRPIRRVKMDASWNIFYRTVIQVGEKLSHLPAETFRDLREGPRAY